MQTRTLGGIMLSDRIIQLVERQADRLTLQWTNRVRTHPATPSYHEMTDEDLEWSIKEVYCHLGEYLEHNSNAEQLSHLFMQIGETRQEQGIPLHELTFAIILARRTLWNFIEQEGVFVSSLEFHQLDEFLHRILNFFDKNLYFVVLGYEKGIPEKEPEKDLVSSLLHSFSLGILPEVRKQH